MKKVYKAASRSSELALAQTNAVIAQIKQKLKEEADEASLLESGISEIDFEIVEVKSKGDLMQHVKLRDFNDKAVFCGHLQDALLRREADFCVHSLKDMSALDCPEFATPAVYVEDLRQYYPGLEQEAALKAFRSDILLYRSDLLQDDLPQSGAATSSSSGTQTGLNDVLRALPESAVIGTGSARRAMQIRALRDDLLVRDIRGNVKTRIEKLKVQDYDAIILAQAGLKRIGLEQDCDYLKKYGLSYCLIDASVAVPASGQGFLACETLKSQSEIRRLLEKFACDRHALFCAEIEKNVIRRFGAGCHSPISVNARLLQEENFEHLELSIFNGLGGLERAKQATAEIAVDYEEYLKVFNTQGVEKAREYIASEISKSRAVLDLYKEVTGSVTLCGVGPGNPELLTAAAYKAMREADVIVLDRLGTAGLYPLLPEKAEVVYAGKSGHDRFFSRDLSATQNEITEIIKRKADECMNVLRLKGGDPYIFGRGAEELKELSKRGVETRYIPGISAALSPGLYGIPLTSRDDADKVMLLSGHLSKAKGDEGVKSSLKQAAGFDGSIVIFMPLTKLDLIVNSLVEFGMPPERRVCMIEKASLPGSRRVYASLGDIAEAAEHYRLQSPTLLMISQNIPADKIFAGGLLEEEVKPLTGLTLWMTRANSYGFGKNPSKMSKYFIEEGAEVIEAATLKFKADDAMRRAAAEKLKQFIEQKVIRQKPFVVAMTSPRSVDAFFDALSLLEKDRRILADAVFAVTGKGSAEVLRERGYYADIIPTVKTGEGLAEEIIEKTPQDAPVIALRSALARPVFADLLLKAGREVYDVSAYTMVKRNMPARELFMLLKASDALIFSSSSGVDSFCDNLDSALEEELLQDLRREEMLEALPPAFCIGPLTFDTALKRGLQEIIQSKEPDAESLAAAVAEYFER